MEINTREVIFLAIFIIIGVVLFSPIVSTVNCLTKPGTYTTVVSGNVTTTSFVPNPEYVGSSNATLVSLVPLFYLLVLIIVPAVIVWKLYKE